MVRQARSHRARLALPGVVFACLTLAAPARAIAHELGTTRIGVSFSADGTFQVAVCVDPESLLSRLELLSGRTASTGIPTDQLPARIGALQNAFLERTRLLFDGRQVAPSWSYLPAAAPESCPTVFAANTAPTAIVRLTGAVPNAARTFQINYGLVLGSYALTLSSATPGPPRTLWLVGGQDSPEFDLRAHVPQPSGLATLGQYFGLGFTHIVPKGLDHMLFVLGLFLLGTAWRVVLLQVTMFTVSHSITLALAVTGWVAVSPSIVEPLIALSIVYVAVENLFTSSLKPWRTLLVFACGLLHGMGFAGVLGELGLPRGEFLPALVGFNAGVEAGQFAVIAGAFALVGWWRLSRAQDYRRWIVVPASLAIATVGMYWTVARIAG